LLVECCFLVFVILGESLFFALFLFFGFGGVVVIVQVSGDPDKYSPVRYRLGDRVEETYYSCEALRRFLGEEVLLLAPESLVSDLNDFRGRVERKGLTDFELFLIPAVGE